MEIRLAGYESRLWSEHFCEFVKVYAKDVAKAHLEIKQWAANFGLSSATSVPFPGRLSPSPAPIRSSVAASTLNAGTTTSSPSVQSAQAASEDAASPPAKKATSQTAPKPDSAYESDLKTQESEAASSKALEGAAKSSENCDGDSKKVPSTRSLPTTAKPGPKTAPLNAPRSTVALPAAKTFKAEKLGASRWATESEDVTLAAPATPSSSVKKAPKPTLPVSTLSKDVSNDSRDSNTGPDTKPKLVLPSTSVTSIHVGLPDSSQATPGTAAHMVFQGPKTSKAPAQTTSQGKQAPQGGDKAPLPAKKPYGTAATRTISAPPLRQQWCRRLNQRLSHQQWRKRSTTQA